jgi:hypothetical protein
MESRPMPSRQKTIALAATLAGGLATAGVLFFFDPARAVIYPLCLFHRLTGLDCPACGSLRALHQLLHGHWAAAWSLNAFLVVSLPLWMGLGLRLVWREIQGRPAAAIRPLWLWLYLGAWLAFGILRNLPELFSSAGS